jgi:hypothetical protein
MYRLLMTCLLLMQSYGIAANDKISWDIDLFEVEVAQGQTQTFDLTLSNMPDVKGVKLHIVPELQPWITVLPSLIENTTIQTHSLTLVVTVPKDSPIGTFDGVLQVRELKAGKPKNVLPSPLPIILTITEFTSNLPPDPGPENDLTLAGIDSDLDGVRDDVQRYIAFKYEDQEALKLALMDVARTKQLVVTQADDKEASRRNVTQSQRAFECIFYLVQRDSKQVVGGVTSQQMNTRERSKAYVLFHQQIAGFVTVGRDPDDYYKSCSFDVNAVLGGN